jgi:hypothetical protein|nr:MAG TPA: hypothetical protein [Caudoviricetes sp.]
MPDYGFVLHGCQRPLPGLEVQGGEFCFQFGIQFYPSVQLDTGTAGRTSREVGLSEVAHVDCFHNSYIDFALGFYAC